MPSRIPRFSEDDPLTEAIAPPADETPSQREDRQRAEAEAKRISDSIDEEIKREHQAEKKAPKLVKILLLGEDGSTRLHRYTV
jgi:hypothetical protein